MKNLICRIGNQDRQQVQPTDSKLWYSDLGNYCSTQLYQTHRTCTNAQAVAEGMETSYMKALDVVINKKSGPKGSPSHLIQGGRDWNGQLGDLLDRYFDPTRYKRNFFPNIPLVTLFLFLFFYFFPQHAACYIDLVFSYIHKDQTLTYPMTRKMSYHWSNNLLAI